MNFNITTIIRIMELIAGLCLAWLVIFSPMPQTPGSWLISIGAAVLFCEGLFHLFPKGE